MTLHTPRWYQANLIASAAEAWTGGARNVLLVLPTGGGKSFVIARIVSETPGAICVAAHRGELVSQLSLALAREGVAHRVIGPKDLARECASVHLAELGRSYYQPSSRIAVASVQTLARVDAADPWFAQVTLWVQDEAHHLLADNMWGRVAAMFPGARGLGVTATPCRADGRGLGRHADGVMDHMVVGPSMRELITEGYLCEYMAYRPPSDIDLSGVSLTESGEYSPPKLKEARQRSHITGDVVKHYLRLAEGKLGVTFDVDVDSATDTALAFRQAGVPAEVVTAKTPGALRRDILRRFRAREILQLVNVDLFGEGFDLPAIEVVSFARPTMSYSLFCQQFGRSLRPMEGKKHAIILDHVGNIERHGLPDGRRVWTLDRAERRSRSAPSDVVPVRTCLNPECLAVYERTHAVCPFCGTAPIYAERNGPEKVDGDLELIDEATAARLRGEIALVDDAPRVPWGATPEVSGAIQKRHAARQVNQAALRDAMALWGGWQAHLGRTPSEAQRRFFFRFGIDCATARTLGPNDALNLASRVDADLATHNVTRRQDGLA